jgi:hypothetical protein
MRTVKEPDYAKLKPWLLRRVFANPCAALLSHWLFQSIFYMDRTERGFKFGFEALLALCLFFPLRLALPALPAFLLAFWTAHTANFLFNGQLWGVLKQFGWVHTPYEVFIAYARGLDERGQRESSIKQLKVFGSLARDEWTPTSDLDARLLRYPGPLNGLRACWFLLRERTRALFHRFPLDCYVLDSPAAFEKMRGDEGSFELSIGLPHLE